MTDGIIQEVFNAFRAKRLGQYITHEETLHLEQELIEKIREELIHSDEFYSKDAMVSEFIHKLYPKLIGDSKE